MSKLLLIDSSGKGTTSVTKPLVHYAGEKYVSQRPGTELVYRDLLQSNLAPVEEHFVQAMYTPGAQLNSDQKALLSNSDKLIQELLDCDTYIFGVPMYNFSVPGIFKLYIDQIVRAGKTFTFEGGSPAGLLNNKSIIVVTASGGDYTQPPMKDFDFLQPYLRAIFGFLGIRKIDFVSISGRDPDTISKASEQAKKQIDHLLSVPLLK